MSGRFVLKVKPEELEADPFHVVDAPEPPARYDIAPSQPVAVVRRDGGVRRLALLRWGLVPHRKPPRGSPGRSPTPARRARPAGRCSGTPSAAGGA